MNNWKKARARVLAAASALSMSAGLLTPALTITTLAESADDSVLVDVYPKPQSIVYDEDTQEGMSLPSDLEVVIKGDAEEVWKNKLETVLNSANLNWTYAETASGTKAVLKISTDIADLPASSEAATEALSEKEGYVLHSDNDADDKGLITLVAADQDGIWNGILTLEQLLEQKTEDGRIAEAMIADYPDIKMRGFVEGFYGLPWSFENRLALIGDSSEYKINTYIYAPKDDPYHKDQWRDLYPETEAAQLKQLVDKCKENNVEFIWCAHPGNGYNYSTDDDYNTLIAKIEQLYSLGVRRFGLSYDDLSGSSNGANQAALINRVGAYLRDTHGDCGSMITVGQRYTDGWGADWNTYLKPFLSGLDKDVVVMWTGKNTGGNCDADSFEGPKNRVGYEEELAMWFNFPVNDMAFGRLLMGAVDNMDPELAGLRGFFMNPMNQAQASKVAIYQGADYSWNIHDYDAQTSWDRAIREVTPEHAAAFKRFASNTSYHRYEDLAFNESAELKTYFDAFDAAVASNQDVAKAAADLKAQFVQVEADADELLAMDDALLLADINQHLAAYKELGQAGIAAMEGVEAAMKLDTAGVSAAKTTLSSALSASSSHTILAMNRNNGYYQVGVEVGVQYIRPFLSGVSGRIDTVFKNALTVSTPAHLISSDKNAAGTVGLVGGNYTAEVEASLEEGGYVGIAFDKAVKVRSFSFDGDENAVIEYSLNGIDWSVYTGEDGNVDAAYARVVNPGTAALSVSGTLSAEVVYPPAAPTASTNMGTYQYYTISNIVDGNLNTKYYSSNGSSVGDYVMVDLGAAMPIHDVELIFAGNPKGAAEGIDGFASTKLEVSADGLVWKQIGDVYSNSNPEQYKDATGSDGGVRAILDWDGNGELGRYVRFSATSDYGNWVQVYEVIINNGILGEDSEVVLASSNTDGAVRNVYDGDPATAFELASPAEGDYLTYALTTITNVGDLLIMQDADTISNAAVSVQKADGSWEQIGTLDAATKTFAVNGTIKNVRLDFAAGTPASISEIVVRPQSGQSEQAVKTLLAMAIEEADRLDTEEGLAGVNALVVDNFHAKLSAAKAVYADSYATQGTVNKAWMELCRAIQMLEFKTDKSGLQALIAECSAIDLDGYEDGDAKNEFIAALEDANEVNNDPAALTEQSIARVIARLSAARDGLVAKTPEDIDLTMLEFLLAETKKIDLNDYVSAGQEEFLAEQAKAEALLAKPTSQEDVDSCVLSLGDAYLNLRRKADESVLAQLREFVALVDSTDLSSLSESARTAVLKAYDGARKVLAKAEPEEKESLAALDAVKAVSDLVANAPKAQAPKADELNTPVQSVTTKSVKTAASSGMMSALAAGGAALAGLLASISRRKRK